MSILPVAKAIKAHLLNTSIADRVLWYDGDSSFDAHRLLLLKSKYKVKFVNEMNSLVQEYNKHVSKEKEIKVKTASRDISIEWTIPERFKNLDIFEHLVKMHGELMADCDQQELDKRELRLCQEIYKFKQLGLDDVLRAVIWIINSLTTNNVVWGVGRGSSVSSYVLYVIGVHDVDSFQYGLNIDDFLHE
jgi:DNA polymerase III alpha subunit